MKQKNTTFKKPFLEKASTPANRYYEYNEYEECTKGRKSVCSSLLFR